MENSSFKRSSFQGAKHHAGDLVDVVGTIKIFEPSIAVRVHPALMLCEMILGAPSFAIRRELIPTGGWDAAAPGPSISTVSPQRRFRGFGSAGRQHSDWRVISKNSLTRQHVRPDGIRQRFQKGCRFAIPIGQGGAVNVDPLALQDTALTIERRVICAFVDQHMGQ